MEQEPEAWQSGAAGPCVTIDGPDGPIELWVLGQQRYRASAPSGERLVDGFQLAREIAPELAGR